jgi:hypothetical protein
MRLQRSACDELQSILCEGRGRYLELEGRPKDKWEGGTFGSSAAEPPHSRECSYMNLLRAEEGAWGGGGVQDGIGAAKRYMSSP